MALIPYPTDDELDPRAAEVLERLPVRINLFSMLANAPAMMRPTLGLGSAILRGGVLDAKLRELAILRTAHLTSTEYEWVQHVPIAANVGVPDEQIDALAQDDFDRTVFDDEAALAIDIVDATLRDERVHPRLVEEGAAVFGRDGLLELLIVPGYYAMLGNVMRAVELDVDEPAAGRASFP
jgi:4-carboxymuconolactone decarboxylase